MKNDISTIDKLYKKKLESNIWKYYTLYFLHLFLFFGAILNIYYLDLNFSLSQIMFISSVMWIFSLILEVPSGIIADLYGKKTTLVISSIAYFVWILLLLISQNYLIILISSIFSGVKISFKSGSDSALLYDTLLELKREKEHAKISGKAISFYLVGTAISAPIGSTIAKYTSIRFTIFLTLFVALVSVLIVLSLQEPKKNTKVNKTFLLHLKESVNVIKKNHKLKWLIILLASISVLFVLAFGYLQMFLKDYNLDLALFGWVYGGLVLSAALSAHLFSKIDEKIKDLQFLKIIAYSSSIILIAIFFFRSVWVFVLLMLLLEIAYGLQKPVQQHYINKEINSDYRATVLSFSGLLISISLVIGQTISGQIGDIFGIHWLFLIMGILSLVGFAISLKKLTKHYI